LGDQPKVAFWIGRGTLHKQAICRDKLVSIHLVYAAAGKHPGAFIAIKKEAAASELAWFANRGPQTIFEEIISLTSVAARSSTQSQSSPQPARRIHG
jgi:hypothetical protein